MLPFIMSRMGSVSMHNIDKDKERRKRRRRVIFLCALLTAIFLIVATYAWLSTTLNVKVKLFKMNVRSDSGLFISLNGIDWDESVTISIDTVINDLFATYPNHTNQWSVGGLWPVSSNGIRNADTSKFEVYWGQLYRTKLFNPNGSIKRVLGATIVDESGPYARSDYIAFDVFFKNASGSPKPDHLFFDTGTGIFYGEEALEINKPLMDGIMNSMRIGLVKIGWVPHDSSISTIQNVPCNNNCKHFIFEPYSRTHSPFSIETAQNYGITLIDGVHIPTYAIINEGQPLEHTNGHVGTGIPLDTSHFALQETITEADFNNWLFELPNGIMKCRIYVWIEGQDIDSLETYSKGAEIEIAINFVKDLAGYE